MNTFYNTIYFAQVAYDNIISDGVLDGRGMKGNLSIGSVALSDDSYRHEIAINMLIMAGMSP